MQRFVLFAFVSLTVVACQSSCGEQRPIAPAPAAQPSPLQGNTDPQLVADVTHLVGSPHELGTTTAFTQGQSLRTGTWIETTTPDLMTLKLRDGTEINIEEHSRVVLFGYPELMIVSVARGMATVVRPFEARPVDHVLLVAPEAAAWIDRGESGTIAAHERQARSIVVSVKGEIDAVLRTSDFERRPVVLTEEGFVDTSNGVVRDVSSRRHEILAEVSALFSEQRASARTFDVNMHLSVIEAALQRCLQSKGDLRHEQLMHEARYEMAASYGFAVSNAGALNQQTDPMLRRWYLLSLLCFDANYAHL